MPCVAASSGLAARPMERKISRRREHPAVFVPVLDVLSPLPVAVCSMYRKLALYRESVSPSGGSLAAATLGGAAAQLNAQPHAARIRHSGSRPRV